MKFVIGFFGRLVLIGLNIWENYQPICLLGDLTPRLEDNAQIILGHRLESVKILPPDGQPPNDPQSYGSITQSAVSIGEIKNPERLRTFCLAITNDNVSGARATTWSATIDQAASGSMAGDEDQPTARLFIISAGNAPVPIEVDEIQPLDNLPIEDPAQSWNALSVGGYTNKSDVQDNGFEDWVPIAQPGELSPFSRTSVTWPQSRSALKPEVVFEAGNRAVNPAGTEASNFDSLSLLTTGDNVAAHPLVPFAATSAAAAQCAKLATELSAAYPQFWPETIGALVVHSAEWPPWMVQQLNNAQGMTARYPLLRKFGHGVPSLERAIASAENHLALFAENEIKPFKSEGGTKRFSDCHFYRLPWPRDILEDLGEQEVRLKLTLSYFIEPTVGARQSGDLLINNKPVEVDSPEMYYHSIDESYDDQRGAVYFTGFDTIFYDGKEKKMRRVAPILSSDGKLEVTFCTSGPNERF